MYYLLSIIISLISTSVSFMVLVGTHYFELRFDDHLFTVYLIILFPQIIFAVPIKKYFLLEKRENPVRYPVYLLVLTSLVSISIILLLKEMQPSRVVVVGTLLLVPILDFIISSYLFRFRLNQSINLKIEISLFTFLNHLIFFILVIVLYYYLFLGTWFENLNQYLVGFSFLAIWFFAGLFNSQFVSSKKNPKLWELIGLKINAGIVLLAFTSLLVFTFFSEMSHIKCFVVISFVYTSGTIIAIVIRFIARMESSTDEVNFKINELSEYSNLAPISETEREVKTKYFVNSNIQNHYLSSMLYDVYLKKFPKVFEFIESVLDLALFDTRRCVIHRSADAYNVEVLPEDYLELFTNLHQVNDIRRINEYFIQVNEKLILGGIFIIPVEPFYLRRKRILKRYHYLLGHLFYFLDFIWKRVCPKFPFIKRVYFMLTKGSNRVLSLSETLGRLYYCGFGVIATHEINNLIYIVSKKIKEPLHDKDPSYGPLFKMKRIGLNGKIIYVYKLRTMHPYAEYLQKFVFERNQLQTGGKLNDDFRVTEWGKIFRKFWIDELPMLINWVKRDLKLVGVRPLSEHYLSLYDEELRKRRKKMKPGLFPPFYADIPKTLKEIMESENRYLDQYEKYPLFTDIKYFFKIFVNIVFRSARSK